MRSDFDKENMQTDDLEKDYIDDVLALLQTRGRKPSHQEEPEEPKTPEEPEWPVDIRVIGVGDGGQNAVERMLQSGMRGVTFIAMNTDRQALEHSDIAKKVPLGSAQAVSRGTGGDPELGRSSAEESREEIAAALRGAQMALIVAGLGGGTGTGAAPVIAAIAKQLGVLTVGIATKPFASEGERRTERAEAGARALLASADAVIILPNEAVKQLNPGEAAASGAFALSDALLQRGVEGLSAPFNLTGLIELEFEDVREILAGAGTVEMAVGVGKGANKVQDAAKAALACPLLRAGAANAQGMILYMKASPETELWDAEEVSGLLTQPLDQEGNAVWALSLDETLEQEMQITAFVTGLGAAD